MDDEKQIADGIELLSGGDALYGGLNDSDIGDPSGIDTPNPDLKDGERRWAEAVAQAQEGESGDGVGATVGLSLLTGLAGAVTVTVVNETMRRFVSDAPRLDELGIRGIAEGLRKAGQDPPSRDALFWLSLGGDLVSNSLFYSLIGRGDAKTVWGRGALFGGLMGLGAATLPEPLGLGRGPTARTAATRAMTIAWYLLGGLATAGLVSRLARSAQKEQD